MRVVPYKALGSILILNNILIIFQLSIILFEEQMLFIKKEEQILCAFGKS